MANRRLKNVAANFVGAAAVLALPLLFNAVFYRLLGAEAYGLVGFFLALVLAASVLDLGLSQTLAREVARNSGQDQAPAARSLAFTLALCLGMLGVLAGLVTAAAAPWVAASWLRSTRLEAESAAASIRVMGAILPALFLINVGNAVLRGLQRQVAMNAIAILGMAARGSATITAMLHWGATAQVFFLTQLAFYVAESAVVVAVAWRGLPGPCGGKRFDVRVIASCWHFAWQVWSASVLSQITLLSDKIILSAALPLHLFGIYSLAFAAASTVFRMITPLTAAYAPQLTVQIETQDWGALAASYHQMTQLAAALILPACLLMLLHAEWVAAWLTGNAASAAEMAPVLALLVAAMAVASFVVVQQTLQLAAGLAWIPMRTNLAVAVIYTPLLVLFAPAWGMYAAAGLWLGLVVALLPVTTWLTHRAVLSGCGWMWARDGILLPGAAAAAVIGALASLHQGPLERGAVIRLVIVYGLAAAAALIAGPQGRAAAQLLWREAAALRRRPSNR